MVLALLLLAAAAPIPVTGDFDHDGLADRAHVRVANGKHEVVIERGAGDVVVIQTVEFPTNLYLAKLVPSTYATACAKGLGAHNAPCAEQSIKVSGDTLQFGTKESSQAAAIWDGDHFRVVWLLTERPD